MKVKNWIGAVKRDERGGVIIMVALALVVLLGMTALVVDVGGMYLARRQMVNAADAAALAGAHVDNNNEQQARRAAEDFALINGAENFDRNADVFFSDNNRVITARTSKNVDFTFAKALGFDATNIGAVASAKLFPANGLVPFGKLGEYDDGNWKIYGDDPEDGYLKEGDKVQLKYERWQQSDLESGNFGYVRLPGQQGGSDLSDDIGVGYTGSQEAIAPGTEIGPEPGQTVGPCVEGLEERLEFADDPRCETIGCLPDNYYDCYLVVIIPVVEKEDGPGGGQSVELTIKGYASFLLSLEEDANNKEVWGIFIEYLNFDELSEILGDTDGAKRNRLVSVPENAFN